MTETQSVGIDGDAGAALESGWRAFRAHPWALMAGQAVFLALGLWAFVNLSLAAYVLAPRSRPVTTADWLFGLGLLLVGVLPWWLAWVGLAAASLRAVRGERLTIGAFFTGLRHPLVTTWAGAAVHVALLGAMALAALPVVVAIGWDGFRDRLDQFALLGGGLGSGAVWLWALGLTVGVTLLAALAVAFGLAVIGVAVAGLAPWGFLVADGVGWRAVPAGWARVRGQRWPLLGLLAALSVLNALGLLAFLVGVVVTGAISACALAGFLDHLVSRADTPHLGEVPTLPGSSAGGPRRPRRWSAWALDGWLALSVATAVQMLVIILVTKPLLGLVHRAAPAYGMTLVAAVALSAVGLSLLLYALAAHYRPPSPGRRMVGPGWGRWEWLALPLAAAVAVLVATAAAGMVGGVGNFAAMGVGQEMGRVLMAELPPGFAASPGYHGDEQWFGGLDIEGGQASGLVEHSYTISNAVGTPYYFKLVRYNQADTAKLALGRLQGPLGHPAAGLGDAAVVLRYPAVVRLAARAGDTIVAAEGPVGDEAELRDLIAWQLARLDRAREQVAPVYRWLPKPEQRLDPGPRPTRTPRPAPG